MAGNTAPHVPGYSGCVTDPSLDFGPGVDREKDGWVIGAGAVRLSLVRLNTPSETASAGYREDTSTTSTLEGTLNANLFKSAYDKVIHKIERARNADSTQLEDELTELLVGINALGDTPYISSVPEFVLLVSVAQSIVQQASAHNTLSGNYDVASALSQAKLLIDGTIVAYRSSQ